MILKFIFVAALATTQLAATARVFIKRVTSRFDGGFDVSSDNPAVKVVSSLNGDQDVNVLGRVVWVWNGKRP